MENPDLKGAVVNALQSRGWLASEGAAIACRSIKTAVGAKDVSAYLGDFGPTEPIALKGVYYSEGRNILEPLMVFLPRDASRKQLEGLALKFHVEALKLIGQSYAVRLLSSNPQLAAQPQA